MTLRQAKDIMSKASMSLTKWGSNSELVSDMLYQEFESKHLDFESVNVLGMKWIASIDCFSFEGMLVSSELRVTKRVILSFIARLFDPLGFLSPFIMLAKCLFQEIWKIGLDWDEKVPVSIPKHFLHWVTGIELLCHLEIPRNYISGNAWCDLSKLELHAFGDAAEKGCEACVYVVTQIKDGTCRSFLVISKAKVAPIKKVTLPRLELLGALLCARLLKFVRNALKLPLDTVYCCWTDLTVVLTWIKSEPS